MKTPRKSSIPPDRYRAFVEHPRYGRRPRLTGLDPVPDLVGGVYLHWHSPVACRVPGTAIPADVEKQARATLAVTHYVDVERVCRDCGRPFLFFAEEQRHWYEELRFPLEADCVRCPDCRKSEQGLRRKARRYESLHGRRTRTPAEALEMVACAVALVEAGVFHARQLERTRAVLNRLPTDLGDADQTTRDALRLRVKAAAEAFRRSGASSQPPGS